MFYFEVWMDNFRYYWPFFSPWAWRCRTSMQAWSSQHVGLCFSGCAQCSCAPQASRFLERPLLGRSPDGKQAGWTLQINSLNSSDRCLCSLFITGFIHASALEVDLKRRCGQEKNNYRWPVGGSTIQLNYFRLYEQIQIFVFLQASLWCSSVRTNNQWR